MRLETITSLTGQKGQKSNKRRNFALLAILLSGTITFVALQRVIAATSPWTQTDWSGGSASGTVTDTVTTYASTSNIVTATAGEITLDVKDNWSSGFENWSYRKTITFDNTTSNLGTTSEDLTNIPILVKLDSGSDIDYTKTKDAGEDIRFVDSDGTELSYEIEDWNESGTSYVWVKVPQIDDDSDTDYIYMYYGNSGSSDGQDAENVWDDFAMVYHLNEPSGTSGADSVSDSTTNTGGTPSAGVSFNQTGKIATTASFTGSTGISLGTVGPALLTDATTIEFWINTNSYSSPSRQNPFEQAYGGWGTMTIETNSRISWFFGSNGGNASPYASHQSSNLMSNSTWIKVTGVRNPSGDTYTWYKDGAYLSGGTHSASYPNIVNQTFKIGDGYVQPINGRLDEFRVSNAARSAAWVAATYKSENDEYNTFGSEETVYETSGTLVSNILDAEFPADWGTLTFNSSGSGTVTVKVRTDSNSDMSGATAWGSCSGISSGSDVSSNGCVTDTHQYLQYQITLEPSGANTPTFEDISIAFAASDQVAPTTNASSIAITGVADGAWTKTEPTITWTAGADNIGGNGLLGYCVSLDEGNLGVSSSLDPESSGGALGGLDDGVTQAYCPFIATGTSLDLSAVSGLDLTSNKQYYFSIKAIDLAGNVWTGASGLYQDLVSFKYDDTSPTNVTFISTPSSSFGSVNDMFFTWPTSGGSAASDGESGVIGWQYSINNTSSWTGPDTEATLGIDYIEDDGSTAEHYLTEGDDGGNVVVGNNTIYFRAVDEAGNYATAVSGGISYGGAAPTFTGEDTVTVTPSTSTSNSYALSWPAATANTGSIESYYYMINTTPPSTLATLQGNSSLYIPTTSRSIAEGVLTGSVKGSNTVYVVAVDDSDNYSPSNYISGTYTLNSSNPDPVQSLAASDTSIKSEEIWRSALAWQAPEYKGNGNLTYKIQRSTNNSTWTDVATTTGLSYTDTVDTSQLYYYRVGVYDTSDDSTNNPTYATSVSITPKGTFDEPPDLSSGPTVSSITTKRATISWSTSRTADSKIQYGTSSGDYFDEEPSKSDQVTSHELLLTNLNPGTKYYYKAKWTDEDGNTGVSDEETFRTNPRPVISEAQARNIGIDSAIIEFTAKGATSIKIYYGESTSFGGIKEVTTGTTESTHTAELTGLNDNTKYFYKINSFDSEAEEYEGDINSFVTLPRPQISNVRIQQVRGTAQPTALVTWDTNTEVSSIVSYYPDGNPSAVRDEVDTALITGEHRMILRGLLPQTRYVLQVSGRDKIGNEAISDTVTVTTATDTRPPLISELKIEGTNIPTVNSANAQPKSQLVITWNTDEAATSQVEYGEGTGSTYSQRTQEDTNLTYNHLVVISGLTPAKVYHLRAISKDTVGNVTESIDVVTITPKATENALDLVITNLQEAFGFLGGIQ